MNTDGFFIANMGDQFLEANVTNQAGVDLADVRVYIESFSDTGIAVAPQLEYVGDVPVGSTFRARFRANYAAARPGVTRVSIIVEAAGFVFRRIIKKIFVTRVDYDPATRRYDVVAAEGTMRIRIHKAIMGPRQRCGDKDPFVVLPTDVTYEWVPNPAYAGERGPYPWQDPWWKLPLAILAALFALGALLYDYFSDGSLDGGTVSVSGTFEETEPSVCCSSVSTSAASSDDWLERGLYAAAGGLATAAIASDGPDLHYRGQAATVPSPGELTIGEAVRLTIDYVMPPSLGANYPIEGDWKYSRTTTGASYSHGAHDVRDNIHYLATYRVDAPVVHDRRDGPLRVCASFERPDGSPFTGSDLYVTAVLVSTYGAARRFELRDDGRGPDAVANDGSYCGAYQFRREHDERQGEHDRPGDWYLFVFAQDVNTVVEGTDPFTSAHTIGGFVLTSQLELAFDAPCQLDHDAVIHVV
jgi:hypothetical protein